MTPASMPPPAVELHLLKEHRCRHPHRLYGLLPKYGSFVPHFKAFQDSGSEIYTADELSPLTVSTPLLPRLLFPSASFVIPKYATYPPHHTTAKHVSFLSNPATLALFPRKLVLQTEYGTFSGYSTG